MRAGYAFAAPLSAARERPHPPPRRTTGGPRTPRRLEYQHHFSVRVTGDELATLRARATAAGLSLSRYLVEAALAPGRVPSADDRARLDRALFHLRKVGVNLNQVARKLNGGEEVPPPQLAQALEATARAAEQLRESA